MTSEAPHRPGQEPGEVSPGAGGPAPYGDRPAQQDNGYPGAADLGWAPPPPAGSSAQPAPAWATPDDQRPAWAEPGGQPATGRATAQVPPAGEPGAWNASPQPAWGAPEQGGPAWAAPEQAGPAWGAPEQGTPAWAAAPPAPSGEQAPPAWAAAPPTASPEPALPAWSTPAEQAGSPWGAAPGPAAAQSEQPAWAQPGEPGARGAAQVPTPQEPWGAPTGPTGQPDETNHPGGWGGPPQDDQPAWGQPTEAAAPAWASAEPTARAAAKVSVPGAPADNSWPAAQDDPDRSGGWAAGRAAGQAEAPQPSAWGAAQLHDQDRPADEPAQAGRASAAVPTPGDRPESGAWTPARASVSVPAADSSSAWGGMQDNPAQRTPEHPAIPDAEPWAPGEAWGRSAEAAPGESPSNGWEPGRAGEAPIYQPAAGPGISPANAVPLPPQEQRVPGATLAASPPTDYAPPAQFEPAEQGYEPEQAGWGTPEPAHEEPQSPAGPVVPGPRTSPESGAAGAVSASASVPMASRVTPPTDQPLHPAGVPAPQPRVYGRPAHAEPEEVPGQDAPNGFPESGPRFDEPGPPARFEEPDRSAGPHAFAEAPLAPSSPAGPPPFPPGVPSFVDPVGNNRPVNGVHPQSDERPGDPFGGPGRPDPFGVPGGQPDPYGVPGGQPDPYGAPGGQPDPYGAPGGQPDPYGAPGGQPDPYGAPGGQPDPYGAPGSQPNPYGAPGGQADPFGGPGSGRASVGVPGPGAMGEPGTGGFPPPQPAPPAWSQAPTSEPEQGRFDAFKPDAEPQTEAPTPKVRNGRVLALVLIAAVLILAVPLGLLTLLGKIGGSDEQPAPFNPAVGACIKQSGTSAAKADCAEPGAFKVVSKVDSKEKCGDPTQPQVVLPGDGTDRVLCLKPASK
ncbi:LppU/SCO3897 family protein [Micromonospora narathiwatensis]|uniref:Integrin beta 8 n=1 Tax=Micromonospora narathiwatensis TaxID=299146 RepID=A0A1A9AAT3_9ACTN|nr:hypothetical protein [Micromonospora narathiwatensis]SBT53597.1 hypothetical protein GA0070621_4861 [Micromonospora narathiwatensis]